MTQSWLPWLLLLQGVLAGTDTLLNHELIARLPQRQQARIEVGIHVLREVIWTILLSGLAWFAWHGAAAAVIAALLGAEVLVTAWDELVENRSRVLPQSERVLQVFLTLFRDHLGICAWRRRLGGSRRPRLAALAPW